MNSKVCITRTNRNIKEAVFKSFQSVINEIPEPVLIKPNFLCSLPSKSGVTTDMRILEAIVKFLLSNGIKEIYLGESSGEESTLEVFKKLGVFSFQKFGVKIINFDNEEHITVNSPTSLTLKEFSIPKIAQKCKTIISVPKMKTHANTLVSLGMKNLFAFLPRNERKKAHILNIHNSIVDIFSYFYYSKKLYSITDGIFALEGPLGPISGNVVNLNLVISSNDILANDIVCSKIMSAKKIPHLEIARSLSLGCEKIELIGEKIENVKYNFKLPPNIIIKISPIYQKLFRKYPYLKNPENCIYCKSCGNACPTNAISYKNKKPIFDYKKCISCFCCIEMCKYGALDYKMKFPYSFIFKILKKILK